MALVDRAFVIPSQSRNLLLFPPPLMIRDVSISLDMTKS